MPVQLVPVRGCCAGAKKFGVATALSHLRNQAASDSMEPRLSLSCTCMCKISQA